jgi:restriction endonuclease S subunit
VNWSVAHLLNSDIGFTKHYPFVKIGDVIRRNTTLVSIEDKTLYKQIMLKTNGGGAVLRDKKWGKDIGTKKQYLAKEGQFIMSKIDARNGAFGVVSKELDNAIVTGDFPLFDVDTKRINPIYLYLLSATKPFVQYAQSCSRGTTNRQRIDIDAFLSLQIPLPSLEEQNKIVAAYNATIAQADILSAQAQSIDGQIQNYIQKELGIESKKEEKNNQQKGFLHIFNFHQLWDRWDMLNTSSVIFDKLSNSKYQIVTLGSTFKCVMRSWKKEGTTFNYIEMGCVNPSDGIIESQTIDIRKAPSRATQIVHAGDLIIGTTRPYLKRFAIVTEQYHNNICSSAFQVIAPDKTYNLHFLHEFLLTSFAVEQFEHFMTGALYPAITNKDLKKIQIPLPPLDIQNEIVEHITLLREKQKTMIEQAKERRKQAAQQFEQTIFE